MCLAAPSPFTSQITGQLDNSPYVYVEYEMLRWCWMIVWVLFYTCMWICITVNGRILEVKRKTCCLTHCLIDSHPQSGLRLNCLSACRLPLTSIFPSFPHSSYLPPPCSPALCLHRIMGKCSGRSCSRTGLQILPVPLRLKTVDAFTFSIN